jgi:hypothetical protein
VFGDVGQPLHVRRVGGEVPVHEVVVHRRTRLAIKAFLLGMAGKYLLHRADTPYPVLRRHEPTLGEFVGDESIPVRRVVGMDLQRSVDEMGIVPVALRDRLGQPLVVGLPGDPQHPARHHDRHPHRSTGRGQFTDERERYFPGRFPCAR